MEGRRGQEGGREMWGQTGGEREAQNGKEGYRREKERGREEEGTTDQLCPGPYLRGWFTGSAPPPRNAGKKIFRTKKLCNAT